MFGDTVGFQPILLAVGILAALLTLTIMASSWGRVTVKKFLFKIFHRGANLPDDLDDLIEDAGYSYDSEQDLFYSNRDAWQRTMGYSRLYDEAAASMGMIIDCEPITFQYQGSRWLIEFWKGQYGMTSGAEIGIYIAERVNDANSESAIIGVFEEAYSNLFYDCIGDDDMLPLAFYLRKNGTYLMRREDRHWWLTGFKLGEFSEPDELSMYCYVSLKDQEMTEAFVAGMLNAGYRSDEITISDRTVSFLFDVPPTKQPFTRQEGTDRFVQRNNRRFCELYRELTDQYQEMTDKMKVMKSKAPELFAVLLMMGRSTGLLKLHKQAMQKLGEDGSLGADG